MFRHNGKGRTYTHNLKLASILSCVAGIVNITGVLSLSTLTTNVTGHFAFFSERLFLKDYRMAIVYLFYIFFFLFGAFISSFIMEWTSKSKPHSSYIVPIIIEILILLTVCLLGFLLPNLNCAYPISLSCTLLFSMGLQNALVTRVSHSVVRTTHLTGLFTDLGIELSQLFFRKERSEKIKLDKSIFLKLMIIGCFLSGSIAGAYTYLYFKLETLLLPVIMLVFALWYDRLLFRYYHLRRLLRNK